MNELQSITDKIYEIRGVRVMLDRDLADLYQVTTSALNQAVKRNIRRFPPDFMFQLNNQEFDNLKSQIVTSSWGGIRKLPFAFTEQGVAMLSGLLNSDIAINAYIAIMRAFVAMRNYITTTDNITAELREMRAKLALLERNDEENMEAVNDLSEDMRRELDSGVVGKARTGKQETESDRLQKRKIMLSQSCTMYSVRQRGIRQHRFTTAAPDIFNRSRRAFFAYSEIIRTFDTFIPTGCGYTSRPYTKKQPKNIN